MSPLAQSSRSACEFVKVVESTKLASDENGLGTLDGVTDFGSSVTRLGDLNNDGYQDVAVGSAGAVHILFMNDGGSVLDSRFLQADQALPKER